LEPNSGLFGNTRKSHWIRSDVPVEYRRADRGSSLEWVYDAGMTSFSSRRALLLARLVASLMLCGLAIVVVTAAQGRGAGSGARNNPDEKEWIQLFNGKDLKDWSPKFAHHDLGENFNDTFRVEDGLLEVRYDKWQKFTDEFGHLFYKDPFSYYILAAEYRFVGQQVSTDRKDLGWAIRNNGLMIHSPAPQTMLKDQDFPISIEVQLLGGLSDGKPRSTANLCTPGTNVVMNGVLHTAHCTNSKSKTYDGDQWVRVEVEAHGDESIKHIVEGQSVLEYSKPQIGGGAASPTDPKIKVDGTPLTGGYISLQAETAPIDFRKVELLNLEGCMDPKATNYKSYFVKSAPARCKF
jgi:hypothetical protein